MMRGIKPSLLLASVAVVGLALWAGAQVEPTGSRMAVAADRFLASLSSPQSAKASYPYDSTERLNWHFIPRGRKGLPIKELSPEQRALAFGLIQSGLAGSGFLKATTIMSLEQILHELEKGRGPVRDPELYFLTIFGKPADRGQVGLAGRGASPLAQLRARRRQDRRGHAGLLRRQPGRGPPGTAPGPAHARRSRGPGVAPAPGARREPAQEGGIFAEKAPGGDPRGRTRPQPPTDPAVGIAYAELNADQQAMLRALVESYAEDMPDRGRQGLARRDRQRRQRNRPVRLGRPRRPQPGPRLPRPGPDLPDRVQQHPEQRQPHPLGLAEHARRLRHPAQVRSESCRLARLMHSLIRSLTRIPHWRRS